MELSGDSIRVVHPLFPAEGGGSIPTSPLQLHVGQIHWMVAARLNELWHSRFPRVPKPETHSPCFGAEFDGLYYAVAMWGQPIAANRLKDGFKKLELRRFAIAPDAPHHTASRMLAVMRRLIIAKFPHVVGLLSYQDVEVHSGTIYKASGWCSTVTAKMRDWSRRGRIANDRFLQSTAPKIRWELAL